MTLESKLRALVARITDCLAKGGLFNMDVMEAGKVRDLLIDCRTALADEALLAERQEPPSLNAEQVREAIGQHLEAMLKTGDPSYKDLADRLNALLSAAEPSSGTGGTK